LKKELPGKRVRKAKKELVVVNPRAISAGGLRFATTAPAVIEEKVEVKEKKQKQKNDPQLVAAARELKDRWLEEINSGRYLPMGNGKYEVSRGIDLTARAAPAGAERLTIGQSTVPAAA
jgi:hypothetical protein